MQIQRAQGMGFDEFGAIDLGDLAHVEHWRVSLRVMVNLFGFAEAALFFARHSRESGNPATSKFCLGKSLDPAFAGMTS
ncbi:hypothetical protein [Lysobacter gummosus]|uniref:hypothetical protein n=1 Tax=Lysobacter gummosus TaxID=262324 RepID=UPI0036288E74